MKKKTKKELDQESRKKQAEIKANMVLSDHEWFNLRPVLGYSWAMFIALCGGREVGKSYAVMDFFVHQYKYKNRPFTWLRLTEESQKKLLKNNASDFIDPDIRRRYNLDLLVIGDTIYEVTERTEPDKDGKTQVKSKKRMARVLALSTFYSTKGVGLFDKDFLNDPDMYYNIALDEMNREKNEKRTFDIVYAFVNQLENLVRSTKERLRIFLIGNTLEEASDILVAFSFLPEGFGVFKLKSKRAVIFNIPLSEKYKRRRKGTVADILTPEASTFTNQIRMDNALVTKKPLKKPQYILKFTKEESDWFTVWEGSIIAMYNKENKPSYAMTGYIDDIYVSKFVVDIFNKFHNRGFKFHNLITFKKFQKCLSLLKPKG